jgi:2'-5' RNA ligase
MESVRMPPLILTLSLAPEAQARFEALRRLHFPPERNLIPAHLTLFHQLPDTESTRTLLATTAGQQTIFTLRVTGLRSLGRGVAYALASPTLQQLHRELAANFTADLIPQDRQPFHPHIVIQNKATSDAARALLGDLQRDFTPATVEARGFDLWRYLNGPWQHLATFEFQNGTSSNFQIAHQ